MKRRARNASVSLTKTQRQQLQDRLSAVDLTKRDFVRITIVLMLAGGATTEQMAGIVGLHPSMIRAYRKLFEREGVLGLLRPRQVRAPRKYGPATDKKILAILAARPPDKRCCWSIKLVVDRLDGVSYQYVWNFIRKRRVHLCNDRRRRGCKGVRRRRGPVSPGWEIDGAVLSRRH